MFRLMTAVAQRLLQAVTLFVVGMVVVYTVLAVGIVTSIAYVAMRMSQMAEGEKLPPRAQGRQAMTGEWGRSGSRASRRRLEHHHWAA